MKKPLRLSSLSFCDTVQKPDGYDLKTLPEATADNMETLVGHYNNLVEVALELAEKAGIEWEDDPA